MGLVSQGWMAPDNSAGEAARNLAASLIQLLTPDERSVAQALLNFPEDSVGRLMTPEFLAVPEEWTAQQVIDHIRTHGQDKETIHVVYVLDPSGKLIDDIRILQILLCSPDTPSSRNPR
jgi:magnesium transporter